MVSPHQDEKGKSWNAVGFEGFRGVEGGCKQA